MELGNKFLCTPCSPTFRSRVVSPSGRCNPLDQVISSKKMFIHTSTSSTTTTVTDSYFAPAALLAVANARLLRHVIATGTCTLSMHMRESWIAWPWLLRTAHCMLRARRHRCGREQSVTCWTLQGHWDWSISFGCYRYIKWPGNTTDSNDDSQY
jgi:hypothetical protein